MEDVILEPDRIHRCGGDESDDVHLPVARTYAPDESGLLMAFKQVQFTPTGTDRPTGGGGMLTDWSGLR